VMRPSLGGLARDEPDLSVTVVNAQGDRGVVVRIAAEAAVERLSLGRGWFSGRSLLTATAPRRSCARLS
jgi:hypothetical protein